MPCSVGKGNPFGGRWKRAKDANEEGLHGGKLGDEYAALDDDKKEGFRLEWAKKMHNKFVIEKQVVRSEVRENWKKSEYMALGRVCKKEGGGKAGWEQAARRGQNHLKLRIATAACVFPACLSDLGQNPRGRFTAGRRNSKRGCCPRPARDADTLGTVFASDLPTSCGTNGPAP